MRIISQDGWHNYDIGALHHIYVERIPFKKGALIICKISKNNTSYCLGVYKRLEDAEKVMQAINIKCAMPENYKVSRGYGINDSQIEGIIDRPVVYRLPPDEDSGNE